MSSSSISSTVADLRTAAAAHATAYGKKQVSFVSDAKGLLMVMVAQAVIAFLLSYPGILFTAGSETSEQPLDFGMIFLRLLLILGAFYALSGLMAGACRKLPPAAPAKAAA